MTANERESTLQLFGVDYSKVYDKKKIIKEGSNTLWNYAEELIDDSIKRGMLEK
ncbi:hypothetical protein [Pontibacter kalidii]|uniref:hypothetical protein n=1 Tax=Pontibacter kalidii TaxID=2592049 RepID=UPI00225289E7|nr:hypothetical protein [Pontibacter kalidii]